MKTARLHGPGDVRLHEEPDPVPGPGEELIRVTSVGLCGSDRHWFLDGRIGETRLERPLVLGHEIAGVVVEGPRQGLRVAVEPAMPCGSCPTCASGLAHLCPVTRFAGHGLTDGGLRTRMAWPRGLLVPVPDAIDEDDAVMLEALGVALHAVDLGKIRDETSVAVIGCGPIGLLLIQVLAARPARRIVAVEPFAHRRAAALAAGATSATEELPPDEPPVDVAFEVAGEDRAVSTAIDAVRPGGRVVLVGIPGSDQTTFPASVARRKGLTLLLARRMAATDLERAVELVEASGAHPGSLFSTRYALDDVARAFTALADQGGLKVVVQPNG